MPTSGSWLFMAVHGLWGLPESSTNLDIGPDGKLTRDVGHYDRVIGRHQCMIVVLAEDNVKRVSKKSVTGARTSNLGS